MAAYSRVFTTYCDRLVARPSQVLATSLEDLATAGVGFLPVTLVAATAFGVAELRTMATFVLVPVLVVGAVTLVADRRRAALLGASLVAGIVATFFYDLLRFAFIGAGLTRADPIPHIGQALHLEPAWVFGYLWRYLGNGTGLAMAFLVLGFRGVRLGLAFGLFVCSGLLFTLVASPYGTQLLFPLTVPTVVMAIGGHVIYGATLGWLSDRISLVSSHLERRS